MAKHSGWGSGDRLVSFRPATGSFEVRALETTEGDSLRSLGAWAIHREGGDDLWLGTSVGLIRHTISDGRFHLFTTHDGLPGSAVFSILSDEHGGMWLGTNQGLVRFDPSRPPGEQFRSYTTRDGIGNLEFNRHAAFECADGSMYFGGMDGLTGFHPSTIRDNSWVPPIRFTDIRISSREGTRTIEPGALDCLVLAPGDTRAGVHLRRSQFHRARAQPLRIPHGGIRHSLDRSGNPARPPSTRTSRPGGIDSESEGRIMTESGTRRGFPSMWLSTRRCGRPGGSVPCWPWSSPGSYGQGAGIAWQDNGRSSDSGCGSPATSTMISRAISAVSRCSPIWSVKRTHLETTNERPGEHPRRLVETWRTACATSSGTSIPITTVSRP